MSPLLRNLLLALVVVAGALLWWNWASSAERRIARELDALMERVEKGPDENPLHGALKAEEAARSFAEPFRFRAWQFDFETRNRQDLIRGIVLYRSRSDRVAPQLLDSEIEVQGERAVQRLVVRFQGGWQGVGDDAYRFRLEWVETPQGWRIADADLEEIVAPGPGR